MPTESAIVFMRASGSRAMQSSTWVWFVTNRHGFCSALDKGDICIVSFLSSVTFAQGNRRMTNPFESQSVSSKARGDGRPVRSELLREVNDRIREVSREAGVSNLEFVCECGGGDCVAMVELTNGEYDGIRKMTKLVLAPDHVSA